MSNAVVKDSAAEQTLIESSNQLQAQMEEPLGETQNEISGEPDGVLGCTQNDCAMGQLVADALLAQCQDCNFALVDAATIAHGLPQGVITMNGIRNALPTETTYATGSIKGTALQSILQAAVSDPSRFIQVGKGLRFAWNPDSNTSEITIIQYYEESIGGNLYYKIAITDNIRRGNVISPFPWNDASTVDDAFPPLAQIVADYVQASELAFPTPTDSLICDQTFAIEPTEFPDVPCRIIKGKIKVNGSNCLTNHPVCDSWHGTKDLAPFHPCDLCSGRGICGGDDKCTCEKPPTGKFKGLEMFRSPANASDCSEIRTHVEDSVLLGVMEGISAFTMFIAVLTSLAFFVHREHSLFKAASPVFCQIAVWGGFIMGASIFLYNFPASGCMSWIWCLCLGFSLLFGSLLVKTYRIYKIFKPFSTADLLSDMTLLRRLLLIVLMEAGLMCLFHLSNPAELQVILPSSSNWVYWEVCTSSWIFPLALGAMNGTILFFSVVVAYKVRKVWSKFNESKYLGYTIYNTVFLVLVGILVLSTLGTSNPTGSRLFLSLSVNYCVLFSLIFMIYPKLRDHYRPRELTLDEPPPDKPLTDGKKRPYKPFRPPTLHSTAAVTEPPTPSSGGEPPSPDPSQPLQTHFPSDETKDEKSSKHSNKRRALFSNHSGLAGVLSMEQLVGFLGPRERIKKLYEVKTELMGLLISVDQELTKQQEILRIPPSIKPSKLLPTSQTPPPDNRPMSVPLDSLALNPEIEKKLEEGKEEEGSVPHSFSSPSLSLSPGFGGVPGASLASSLPTHLASGSKGNGLFTLF